MRSKAASPLWTLVRADIANASAPVERVTIFGAAGAGATIVAVTRFPVPLSGSKDCASDGDVPMLVTAMMIPMSFFMATLHRCFDDDRGHHLSPNMRALVCRDVCR